jgi:hypothetical protein
MQNCGAARATTMTFLKHERLMNPPSKLTRLMVASIVSLALLYSTLSGSLFKSMMPSELFGYTYARSTLAALSDVIALTGTILMLTRIRIDDLLHVAGLTGAIQRPLLWFLLVFTPVTLVSLLLSNPLPSISLEDIVWLAIGSPLIEEVFYRGLAIGLLVSVCGWRWWIACVWPAVFFALAHLWQGAEMISVAGVTAITLLGGLFFGWLFVKWKFNLWPAILAHIGMNLIWSVFALGDDATGGLAGNIVRAITVLLAIAGTLWMTSKDHRNTINAQ